MAHLQKVESADISGCQMHKIKNGNLLELPFLINKDIL